MVNSVYVVSAVRTPVGAFGGSLKNKTPAELGTLVSAEAIRRATLPCEAVDLSVFGMVLTTEPADAYIARLAAVKAGVPVESPALTVNRLCGSGLQAIISAAQSLMLDDAEIALAGGIEVMSRAPFFAPDVRWGRKMGDSRLVDGLNGALTDPFNLILMGTTAENVAVRYAISRETQDRLAVESHRRASTAIDNGVFADQIVPVPVARGRSEEIFSVDEHVRKNTTLSDLSKLPPLFAKEGGTVTAGNSSGLNDGAAALVIATGEAVRKYQLTPLARLVGYAHSGVDPALMGIGPITATRAVLARTGLSISDLDIVEANEAFAAQACAVTAELQLEPGKVNPHGSGISLGHPVGATGAIITVKLVHELRRSGGRFGLATMCIGGGQGIAAIFERT
jgi:acetyl-CoA C-acetyltransferase